MDDGENKIRRDSCCQSTSQGDELQSLQLCFLMILLALFYSVFWLHLNLVNKTAEARREHAHHGMSRERRLLLEILLKECERIFPQDPSKAWLHLLPLLPPPAHQHTHNWDNQWQVGRDDINTTQAHHQSGCGASFPRVSFLFYEEEWRTEQSWDYVRKEKRRIIGVNRWAEDFLVLANDGGTKACCLRSMDIHSF